MYAKLNVIYSEQKDILMDLLFVVLKEYLCDINEIILTIFLHNEFSQYAIKDANAVVLHQK